MPGCFFFLLLLKTNGIKCHVFAFGMHILAFSVVQIGKGQFFIELVYSVSVLYRNSSASFVTSAILSVDAEMFPE